ncbi:uncharacterized protein KGF55_001783 [Candida pseudojiufengensis]|uniref:uncharacterized protein n=1 Tax=Candida pseudojiufengensis TaxID=497109 RepID=UPI0022248920|nr:uncharacterized protein KGF55_001783 [Candida pseudojiufengensis]KAI5964714.1 hypothetical protein KGF55_001783 [Candida pseudojiufengensis]
MSSSLNKKESSGSEDLVKGSVYQITSNSIRFPTTSVRHLDSVVDEKNASKLLKEAQANLKYSANTGYAPELRRDFNVLSLLGIGFGITNSWYGISGAMIAGISGGSTLILYGIIILAIVGMCIAVTLSEMSSIMPHASAQIFGYVTGILAWLGSVFTGAAVTMTMASAVTGMYVLYNPTTEIKSWQIFLCYEIFLILLIPFNLWERPLPAISTATLYISLLSFFIIIVVVLSMHSGEFQDAKVVFTEFNNSTGWNSSAIAFIIGLVNPNWAFSCLDAATHIAEETLHPETQIPIAIIGTVVVGFITAFSYCVAMFFSINDIEGIMTSNTGVPIMDIFYQATSSKAAAVGLQCLILLTAFSCNIGCHTWSSRIAYSFSRDNGLPFSKYWAKVNERTGTVVNAHVMSCVLNGIIGLIYLGSSSAFNSILVCCVTFLLLSYMIPTLFLIPQRNTIKHGPFWMNKFGIGLTCNFVTCAWAIFAFVFYNFPTVMPVSGGNMNYSSVVVGIVLIICVGDWFIRGRREFVDVREREQYKDELADQLSNQISNIEVVMSRQ